MKAPKYPVEWTVVDDAPKVQRGAQKLPNGRFRAESSEEVYRRAYRQFFRPLPRRLARRRLIREGY